MKDPLEKVGSIIIKAIGEDPTREGLVKTPQRFAGALRTILSGAPSHTYLTARS